MTALWLACAPSKRYEWGVSEGSVKGQVHPSLALSPFLQRHSQRFEWGVRGCHAIVNQNQKTSGKPYACNRKTPSLPALKFNIPKEILNTLGVFSITQKVLIPTPSLLTVTLLPAVGLTLPCSRPHSREQSTVQPVRWFRSIYHISFCRFRKKLYLMHHNCIKTIWTTKNLATFTYTGVTGQSGQSLDTLTTSMLPNLARTK